MKMKGNLISLISVIFILLVGLAMTGCMTPLHNAAIQGDINAVKALLDQGADVNEKGGFRETPLTLAAYNGHIDVVKLLIDRGADVNEKNRGGYTPLALAAYNGHADIAKLLIDSGADIDYARIKLKLIVSGMGGIFELRGALIGTKLLEQLAKKPETAVQSNPIVTSQPQPTPKSDVDELPAIKAGPNKGGE